MGSIIANNSRRRQYIPVVFERPSSWSHCTGIQKTASVDCATRNYLNYLNYTYIIKNKRQNSTHELILSERAVLGECRGSNAAEHGETAKRKRAMMFVIRDREATENPMDRQSGPGVANHIVQSSLYYRSSCRCPIKKRWLSWWYRDRPGRDYASQIHTGILFFLPETSMFLLLLRWNLQTNNLFILI